MRPHIRAEEIAFTYIEFSEFIDELAYVTVVVSPVHVILYPFPDLSYHTGTIEPFVGNAPLARGSLPSNHT
jgi:hypothetical protein